jgi:hypothetical protein
MINIISYKTTLLCYFWCHYIRSSQDLVFYNMGKNAVLVFVVVLHSIATSSHENLLIINTDSVPTAFYSPLISPSAKLMQLLFTVPNKIVF